MYSPTTLITEFADKIDRGIQVPVSSSTSPRLMIRMLEALEVSAGIRALEIGTGYNAALLSHRLSDRNVCSIDIDRTWCPLRVSGWPGSATTRLW
ncbi:MAG: hypothetical protein ACRDTC_11595 [Pseudonocardiaceae bacterium]